MRQSLSVRALKSAPGCRASVLDLHLVLRPGTLQVAPESNVTRVVKIGSHFRCYASTVSAKGTENSGGQHAIMPGYLDGDLDSNNTAPH